MDTSDTDQRLPHMSEPPEMLDLDQLKEKTGVLYWKINADDVENDALLQKIRKDRGYTYEDQVNITEQMPEYEKKIKMFFEEHLHTDEEIRLIVDGSGYFDARDQQERWIRIEMEKGDMIVLPAGIYHRFTLDTKNFIIAKRYFVGEPIWTPHNRSEVADKMEARIQYVADMGITVA